MGSGVFEGVDTQMPTITKAKPCKVWVSELLDRIIVCDIFLTKNELILNLKNKILLLFIFLLNVELTYSLLSDSFKAFLGKTLFSKMITYKVYS